MTSPDHPIAAFNRAFDFYFAPDEPLDARTRMTLMEYAALRGRHDISEALLQHFANQLLREEQEHQARLDTKKLLNQS